MHKDTLEVVFVFSRIPFYFYKKLDDELKILIFFFPAESNSVTLGFEYREWL